MSDRSNVCPNCRTGELEPFYVQRNVPVNSVVLLSDRDQAERFPRGDISLGYCSACGFACNTQFDAEKVRYDGSCEETQGSSPTFNTYHQRLVEELVLRHDLRGKHVVEIGCGKGEFLALLCRLGANRGTGFDPAYVPGRVDMPPGVAVHQQNFTHDRSLQHADFLYCKMTLEHIAAPLTFLRSIRTALGEGNTPVYFQVPDAGRIYRQRAFWDIYHEHCSYFTDAALHASFAAAGFMVDEITRDYAEQYLVVHAHAATGTVRPGGKQLVDKIGEQVDGFRQLVDNEISHWRSLLIDNHATGKPVVIWGGGSKAVAFLSRLNVGSAVDRVVDVNPRKHGTWLPGTGHPVVAPSDLEHNPPSLVVVMNHIYLDEIQDQLAGLGLTPRLLALP